MQEDPLLQGIFEDIFTDGECIWKGTSSSKSTPTMQEDQPLLP